MNIRNAYIARFLTGLILFGLVAVGCAQESKSIKDQSLQTMLELKNAMLKLQIIDENAIDHGALNCPHCNIFLYTGS